MYVAINRESMGFLYAHPSYEVLLNMVHIEVDAPVHVVNLEHPAYYRPMQAFSTLELLLLYKNTTGEKYVGHSGLLQDVVTGLAMRIPELKVKSLEVAAQAGLVADDESGLYKFVPGSHRPKLIQDGLFGVPNKSIPRSQDQELAAAQGTLLPQLPAPVAAFAPTGRDRASAGTSTPARTRPAGTPAPPRGSTRETIWTCADRMWKEAGEPKQPSAVLALRKKIMDQLEQEGVKRTSSSNELGNWAKVRIV